MNPAAPKVHSFFFTRKSVDVSQSWATAGTPYSIHIPSTFHPHFIQISSIVHAYSYSFLQNDLIFIGGMKSGEQISSFFHIPCIFHANILSESPSTTGGASHSTTSTTTGVAQSGHLGGATVFPRFMDGSPNNHMITMGK